MINITIDSLKKEFFGSINPRECYQWCLQQFEGLKMAKLSLVMLALVVFMLALLIPHMRFKYLSGSNTKAWFYETLMITGILLLLVFLSINW